MELPTKEQVAFFHKFVEKNCDAIHKHILETSEIEEKNYEEGKLMGKAYLISRNDAVRKLIASERQRLCSLSKEQLVEQCMQEWEPPWHRMRNYEFEYMLNEAFLEGYHDADVRTEVDDKWLINEPCQFNG